MYVWTFLFGLDFLIIFIWGIYSSTQLKFSNDLDSDEGDSQRDSDREVSIEKNLHEDVYGKIVDIVSKTAPVDVGDNVEGEHSNEGIS